ncbi:hypothetical protein EJB05_32133, partial [Eragrostis curvula]
IKLVAAETVNLGEAPAHPLVVANVLHQGPLPDAVRPDDGEDVQILVRRLRQQEADDFFLLHLPPEHAVLHEQVGAVRLLGDARVASEEHHEFPHNASAISARRRPCVRSRSARREVRSRSPTWIVGSAPEGVERVGRTAQLSPQLVELQQHRSVGDLPALGFLHDDASSEQSALQPDGVIGGAGLLVLPDEEGDQPADEVARHRRQKCVHCLLRAPFTTGSWGLIHHSLYA